LIAGLVAGSVALIGFGADSIIDGSASAVLVWRFNAERSVASHSHAVERRAARLVGAILVLVGLDLAVTASFALANHSHPERTVLGAALTAASVLVLPVLALRPSRSKSMSSRNRRRFAGRADLRSEGPDEPRQEALTKSAGSHRPRGPAAGLQTVSGPDLERS
jgi:hypothetical protein